MRIFSTIRPALGARVTAAVPDVDVVTVDAPDAPLPPGDAEVLLTYAWEVPNLAALLPRGVRWVHALGTGIDSFPLELLGDRVLTCSRGASAVPIAEWVLAVMLAFEKGLPEAWIHAPPPEGWSRGRRGTLAGRTLGLIGLGGIGSAVATRALPFAMRVRALRRTAQPSPIAGVEIATDLHELLGSADHLVLAAPATAATRHLLDAAAFAAMKPGVHLVNIARGALVEEPALRTALDEGRVAMASLDAVDPEPLPAGHWLYAHPRVRLSPHVSWQMPGAANALLDVFIDNLHRYRRGEPLRGVVDRAAGY